jgi:hypothetical protein
MSPEPLRDYTDDPPAWVAVIVLVLMVGLIGLAAIGAWHDSPRDHCEHSAGECDCYSDGESPPPAFGVER